MNFCEKCNNILFLTSKDGVIKYECKTCNILYPLKSGIIDSRKVISYDKKNDILNQAMYDNTFPISNEKCPKCGDYLVYYLNTKTMVNWIICRKCTLKEIENTQKK